MNTHLEEDYFIWLYSQVASVRIRNTARTHWSLCRQLHQKEFIWLVPNDDNRVEDGRNLRYEFLKHNRIRHPDQNWLQLGCSMFEMLIGLSRRLSFEGDGEPREWFWELIDNLGLMHTNDQIYDDQIAKEIDEALDRVIWRQYASNGMGGLFPIVDADCDQRQVEIWYQMSSYLMADI